jgi:ASC-1-like (ASCH) protein
MIHELKCWHEYFVDVKSGKKTFEVRLNNRNYRIGHYLHLKDYDNILHEYTGDEVFCKVTYVLYGGDFGIADGWVVMSIKIIKKEEQ